MHSKETLLKEYGAFVEKTHRLLFRPHVIPPPQNFRIDVHSLCFGEVPAHNRSSARRVEEEGGKGAFRCIRIAYLALPFPLRFSRGEDETTAAVGLDQVYARVRGGEEVVDGVGG